MVSTGEYVYPSNSNTVIMSTIARMATNKNHSLLKKLPIASNRRFIAESLCLITIDPTIGPDVITLEGQAISKIHQNANGCSKCQEETQVPYLEGSLPCGYVSRTYLILPNPIFYIKRSLMWASFIAKRHKFTSQGGL